MKWACRSSAGSWTRRARVRHWASSSRAVWKSARTCRSTTAPRARGRAAGSPLPAGTAPAPGCRPAPLPAPYTPWWRSTPGPAWSATQFVLGPRGRVRERREHVQPLAEMTDGFHIGRALDGPLTGPLPIGNAPAPSGRPPCSAGRVVQVGSRRGRQSVPLRPGQCADGSCWRVLLSND